MQSLRSIIHLGVFMAATMTAVKRNFGCYFLEHIYLHFPSVHIFSKKKVINRLEFYLEKYFHVLL